MYLFIYKTIHKNGRYYIGRHQTHNLNDGYLGSGVWIKGIKDKSSLTREVLTEATTFDELKRLEEQYIIAHWDNPLCMNKKKGSTGNTSEDAKRINQRLINNGTHHWLLREDGTSLAQEQNILRVKEGTHNFLKRKDGTSLSSDRVKKGTHNLLKREDGSSIGAEIAKKQVIENRHPFQRRSDGSSIQTDKIKNKKHNLLKREDGSSIGREITLKRLEDGTHNLKGNVSCYNKYGICKQINKEEYFSQSGKKSDWEWVAVSSKEGKRRKLNFKPN